VGDIFRALTPILAERTNIKSVALPVVAAGNQGHPVAEMLAPLDVPTRRRLLGGLGVLRKVFAAGPGLTSRKSHRTPAKRRSYLT